MVEADHIGPYRSLEIVSILPLEFFVKREFCNSVL